MKKKISKKRIVAGMLAAVSLTGVLSGCGGKEGGDNADYKFNKSGYPIVDEKITLEVMGETNGSYPDDWNDLLLFKELEKKTNIHLDFRTVGNGYDNQKNLAFASGDLPDFFYKGKISTSDELTYGGAGVLVDLVPYLSYMPNLNKAFEEVEGVKQAITMDDGKIVSLPEVNEVPRDRSEKMFINKEWLDKLGLEEPETADDWYNVLKAFKTQDPNGNGIADEVPLTFSNVDNLYHMFAYFGVIFHTYVEDGKFMYSPADERAREGLKFFAKLYKEGLLDNQCFTQGDSKFSSKVGNETPIVGCFVGMGASGVTQDHRSDYVVMTPLKTENGKRIWKGRDPFGKGPFAMTNKNKYPEATMRLIDYLYSEEGGILARLGVEGYTYKMKDNGAWTYTKPDDWDQSKSMDNLIGTVSGAYSPMRQPADMLIKADYIVEDPDCLDNQVAEKLADYLVVPVPSMYLNEEEQKKVNSLYTDLASCSERFIARTITGEIDVDSEWDAYISDLKRIGLDEYEALYQKKYDEYKKK